MNTITEVTRRAIIDFLSVGPYSWHGRLDEVECLSRVFDLSATPSTDGRFEDASGDIWQHRINNPGDWDDDWVFHDSRFNLLCGPDETFLRFLCELVHPVVRPDEDDAVSLVAAFNEHLVHDGWEIVEKARTSNRPLYAARRILEGAGVWVKAAKEVAFKLDADYVSQQITRMEVSITADPELAIGTAKEFLETVCRTILADRSVPHSKDEDFPKLVKLTVESVKLVPDEVTGKATEQVRVLLKNLTAISHQLAELRNAFGTGHGKSASHQGLEARHARLMAGAATALGVFLFESHQSSQQQKE